MQPSEPTATASEPVRGTIILDSYALKKLAVRIKANATEATPSGATYLDTLSFLAHHGYRIVIPEVASIISASILASGEDLGDYFPTTTRSPSAHSLAGFLKQVARDQIPNISIVGNTGPDAVNAYCNNLHAAIAHGAGLKRSGRVSNSKGLEVYPIIARIRRDTDTSRFCDNAVMAILEDSLHGTDKPQPTYVLSDNRNLRMAVDQWAYQHQSPLKEFDTTRFVASLAAANLSQPLNFKPTVDSSELTFGFFDDSGKNPPYERAAWFNTIGRSAFCQNLKGLAAELEAKAADQPEIPPTQHQPSERATRFAAKFGGALGGLTARKPSGIEGPQKGDISR